MYSGGDLLADSSSKDGGVSGETAGGEYGSLYLHLVVRVQPVVDAVVDVLHLSHDASYTPKHPAHQLKTHTERGGGGGGGEYNRHTERERGVCVTDLRVRALATGSLL